MPTVNASANSPAATLLSIATPPKAPAPSTSFDAALTKAAKPLPPKKPTAAPAKKAVKPKDPKTVASDSTDDDSTADASTDATQTQSTDDPTDSSSDDSTTPAAANTAQKNATQPSDDGDSTATDTASPNDEADIAAQSVVATEATTTTDASAKSSDDTTKTKSSSDTTDDPKSTDANQQLVAQTATIAQQPPAATPAAAAPAKTAKTDGDAKPVDTATAKPVTPETSPTLAAAQPKQTALVSKPADATGDSSSSDSEAAATSSDSQDVDPTLEQLTPAVTAVKKAPTTNQPKFATQAVAPDVAAAAAKTPDPVLAPAKAISVSTAVHAVQALAGDDSDDDSADGVKDVARLDAASGAPDPTQLIAPEKTATHVPATTAVATPSLPALRADAAATNHDKIVNVIKSELTPGGGSMKIRLDPPELGSLQVTVKMTDGVMTASFETSNDTATRMLSHSLGQLKTTLESAGVSVERLHVTQSSRESSSDSNGGSDDSRQQARGSDTGEQQREQQRKEMIRRMWAKLGVGDPLDLVA